MSAPEKPGSPASGAFIELFMYSVRPLAASKCIRLSMPKIVPMCGSITVCATAAASTASTALPPSRSTSVPTRETTGCEDTTTPSRPLALVLRPKVARAVSRSISSGVSEFIVGSRSDGMRPILAPRGTARFGSSNALFGALHLPQH